MGGMISSLASWIVVSLTWCFCTACGSLLSSCCGNDKNSSIAPSATSGRKRSVLLLIIAIIIAFVYQYALPPQILKVTTNQYLEVGSALTNVDAKGFLEGIWIDGCEKYMNVSSVTPSSSNSEETMVNPIERCAGNAGVYRACGCATLFFVLAAIAVKCKPSANREAWPAKYVLFLFLCGISLIIPNQPLWLSIYLNIARVGAVLFILAQQLILVDMAYNWNDSWVTKADAAEREEVGSGQKWLGAILACCAILFLGSIVVIGLMFHFFSGCDTNITFISITLVLGIIITAVQLNGEEGSLLSSAVVVAWATYLCYNAVSRNPNKNCNPKIGDDDVDGIILGIGFTLISLGWAGWSYTATRTLGGQSSSPTEDQSEVSTNQQGGERKVAGIVTNYGSREDDEVPSSGQPNSSPVEQKENAASAGELWKLNLILATVSCWVAMALTSWGSIKSFGDVANPEVGTVAMWVIIASQWFALLLYLWTLAAPALFPDRDFS